MFLKEWYYSCCSWRVKKKNNSVTFQSFYMSLWENKTKTIVSPVTDNTRPWLWVEPSPELWTFLVSHVHFLHVKSTWTICSSQSFSVRWVLIRRYPPSWFFCMTLFFLSVFSHHGLSLGLVYSDILHSYHCHVPVWCLTEIDHIWMLDIICIKPVMIISVSKIALKKF